MIGHELEQLSAEATLRFVRALGRHRYVASRLHLVHAFAIDAAAASSATVAPDLADAAAWAARALASGAIDLASKDDRLVRRASDAELAAVLEAFWGPEREASRARLEERLGAIGITADRAATPFDESGEEDLFPVLIDAGWELLPLAKLDPQAHKGAIQALDDFEVAKFDEESAIPPRSTLHELPLLGAVELLHAFDDAGATRAPFVLWQEGHPEYLDYVLRGVLRAAKIEVDA